MTNTLGFIILRHVNSEQTNKYWIHCYDCIRKFYRENWILIIDDNSDYNYIQPHKLHKTSIIQSEYPGRGELLPYYYYLHNNMFDTAVIIHDSVFLNSVLDTNVNTYRFLWHFLHHWDQIEDETLMINLLNDTVLSAFHRDKSAWVGCFGGMCIIKHEYLKRVCEKYDISKLLNSVVSRYNRCSFERVIACLLQIDHTTQSLLGCIHDYCKWDTTFSEKDEYLNLPVIKVWTGR